MTRRFASPSLRDIVVDTETAFAGDAVYGPPHRRGNAQQLRSDGRLRPPFYFIPGAGERSIWLKF